MNLKQLINCPASDAAKHLLGCPIDLDNATLAVALINALNRVAALEARLAAIEAADTTTDLDRARRIEAEAARDFEPGPRREPRRGPRFPGDETWDC